MNAHTHGDGTAAPSSRSNSLAVDFHDAIIRSVESETLDLATVVTPVEGDHYTPLRQSQPRGAGGHDASQQQTQPPTTAAARWNADESPTNMSLDYQPCAELSSLLGSTDDTSLKPAWQLNAPAATAVAVLVRDQSAILPTDLHTPQSGSFSSEQHAPRSSAHPSPLDTSVSFPSAAVQSPPLLSFTSFAQRPYEPVLLSAEHATVSVSQRSCKGCSTKTAVELADFSVSIPHGTFHCILSVAPQASHAALQILAGVRIPTTGMVLGNEVPTFATVYRHRVAWISGVSGLTESLTVRENLSFAYRMRVATSREVEQHVLDSVARLLGLDKLLDQSVARLSRAYAYLLCIGLELVLSPAVLLLDNPLVHFSPPEVTSLFLVFVERVVKGDVMAPVTVVMSTSEVTWPLYRAMDGLTVLSTEDGETVFSGSVAQLEPFLHADAGIPHVAGESIADLLAQMEDSHSTAQMAQKYRQSGVYRGLLEQVQAHTQRAAQVGMELPTGTAAAEAPAGADGDVIVVDASPLSTQFLTARATPQYGTQLGLLLLYMLRKNVRLSLWYLVPWLCLFVVFVSISAVVIRTSFATILDGRVIVQNYFGVLFMMLASACQTELVFIDVEIEERLSFCHFQQNHYLRLGQYLITTVIRFLIIGVAMSLVGTLCALLLGLPVVPLAVLMGLLVFVQSSLLLALVYLCGGHHRLIVYVQGSYYLYNILFSGYLVNSRTVPFFVQSLSMLRYAYGGALVASATMYCENYTEASTCAFAQMVLVDNMFTTISPGDMALLLFGLGVGFFGLAVLLMHLTTVYGIRAG